MRRILDNILAREWDMFVRVNNRGGVADCQRNPETFALMRRSQIVTWPEAVQKSYLRDLISAAESGRNLMTEKYAWMMERTFPEEFAAIRHMLPEIAETVQCMIEVIISINLGWKVELAAEYPRLSGQSRPLCSESDSPDDVSFETYLRGELKTFSPETIRLLYEHTRKSSDARINEAKLNLLHQVLAYGYASLDDAERRAEVCFTAGLTDRLLH